MESGDPRAEFARLLVLAFAARREVRAQQVIIYGTIVAGDHQALRREREKLTNLLLGNRMLSHRLRAVFDNQRAP
jgi:hypothetical protein